MQPLAGMPGRYADRFTWISSSRSGKTLCTCSYSSAPRKQAYRSAPPASAVNSRWQWESFEVWSATYASSVDGVAVAAAGDAALFIANVKKGSGPPAAGGACWRWAASGAPLLAQRWLSSQRVQAVQRPEYRNSHSLHITGPPNSKTPFEHFSSHTMPGPQNVGRSPTCGHFQDGHTR